MNAPLDRSRCRKTIVVSHPEAQVLDVAGPIEVLSRAREHVPDGGYDIIIATVDGGYVSTSCGLTLGPTRRLGDLQSRELEGIDTLLLCGGRGALAASTNPALIGFVREVASRARRNVSICTGALILAEAGLLDGRRAATHWASADYLASRYPAVTVERDVIFVRDGNIWTSAGVTAGIDLALALVSDDFGSDVAVAIARNLVAYMIRPGGQAQFSPHLVSAGGESGQTSHAVSHVLENLASDLSIEALSRLTLLGERTFARKFRSEVGMTPAKFVERARVDAARRLLEQTSLRLDLVAERSGFAHEDRMRRAFLRQLHISPREYRSRFVPLTEHTRDPLPVRT